MEHAQRDGIQRFRNVRFRVLILILMEHAQRAYKRGSSQLMTSGLNPYFNGTCSKSAYFILGFRRGRNVLILILMEHAQRVDVVEIQRVVYHRS